MVQSFCRVSPSQLIRSREVVELEVHFGSRVEFHFNSDVLRSAFGECV